MLAERTANEAAPYEIAQIGERRGRTRLEAHRGRDLLYPGKV
jgi:hypothetical protein